MLLIFDLSGLLFIEQTKTIVLSDIHFGKSTSINKKGSYIHFKFKGTGKIIKELEKNELLDKKLLRYLTVKVKKFDLDTNYFSRKDESEKKEIKKN